MGEEAGGGKMACWWSEEGTWAWGCRASISRAGCARSGVAGALGGGFWVFWQEFEGYMDSVGEDGGEGMQGGWAAERMRGVLSVVSR